MRKLARSSIVLALLFVGGGPASAAQAKEASGEKVLDMTTLIEARDQVLRELDAHPKSLARWKRLAMIQRQLADEKATEEALAEAAALDPKDAGVHFMFGLLHEKRADSGKAAAAFRACLKNAAQDKITELCAKHLRRTQTP